MADSLFLLAIAYRTIYAVAGSYITARLAPERPMWHALVLGAIGVAITTAGTAATWDRGPEFGPHWYPLVLIAITIPCSWAGGKLFEAQLGSQGIGPTHPSSQASHASHT
jgi:surface polysaccharide O-acyltransferase-like enzyme